MISKITALFKRLWAAAPVATIVLILALSASVVFGVRSVMFWHKAPPWTERQQEIAAWMSPRYISRSWRIPLEELLPAIGVPVPPTKGPMSLSDIAELRSVTVEQVIGEAHAAIKAFHAKRTDKDDGQ